MDPVRIDTLLSNGRFYTLQEEGMKVEALGIDQGRIVFAGTFKQAAERFIASETINLNGKTVIPGMGDSHLHLYAHCQNLTSVRLDDIDSMSALISRIKEKAASTEKGQWIKGAGFDQTKFTENRMPTRWDLDRITTDHPVVVKRCCLHVLVANSMAMEMAEINDEKIKLADGLIETDPAGIPTGVFREKSTGIFDELIPDPLSDPHEKMRLISDVLKDMVSKGITSINTYAAKIWNYEENLATYQTLQKEGLLPLRVAVSLDELFEVSETQNAVKDPFEKVKYGAYKLFTDGSLGAKSAALLEPYSDEPSQSGILVISKEQLCEKVLKGDDLGLQTAIHAIGDRAMEMTLDAIEAAVRQRRVKKQGSGHCLKRLPFRIIHAQVVNNSQVERLQQLPVILDIQPVFLCTDLYWIESRLGKDRIKNAYLWKTMTDQGILLAGGSDCPVESYDPMLGIYAAVTRQDMNGFPPGGWEPNEKLSIYEAVCLFTKNIAYTSGDEDVLGTLEPNKFADFVVLNQDPFEMQPENIKDIKVLKTFVAGKMVYDSVLPH